MLRDIIIPRCRNRGGTFQWAPTLGGECYSLGMARDTEDSASFNGHPPLGVNATVAVSGAGLNLCMCFNGHPPLGVNATVVRRRWEPPTVVWFQWAPTLGGECYSCCIRLGANYGVGFNGHPPLGVNATYQTPRICRLFSRVSMGTHPWG